MTGQLLATLVYAALAGPFKINKKTTMRHIQCCVQ